MVRTGIGIGSGCRDGFYPVFIKTNLKGRMRMSTLQKVPQLMRERTAELMALKSEGKKIIGYFPGGYFPEEMVCAAGAIPVALNRGGDHEPVEVAGVYMSRWMYTFARANIGNKMLGTEPVYEAIDIFMVPVTDNHVRILADTWEVFTDVEVFRFGVPHVKHDHGLTFFEGELLTLKEKLEQFTGNRITNDKLLEAINLSNRERELLEEISQMRMSEHPPISGKEFIMLNHASLLLDKQVMVDQLEKICSELKEAKPATPGGPRILLTGTTMAHGDTKVLELITESGGQVVVEEFGEGIRHFQEKVNTEGDLIKALAKRYFWKRIPPAWFRPGTERQELILQMAKSYKVDGVIWYQLMARESDEFESFWYPEVLKKEAGLPMLKLVSDYDAGERGGFSTRIETFIESIRS